MSPPRDGMAPVKRQRVVDSVYDAIRQSILSGRFAMGERLVETSLADQLQVSRAPIREAFRRLQDEGLVVEQPHRGVLVREFDGDAVVDLYNVRLALEAAALLSFMRRSSPVEPLRGFIGRMREAARTGDVGAVAEAELAFHVHIAAESGNRLLLSMYRAIRGQVHMLLHLDDSQFSDPTEVAAEHEPIVDAIVAGDEDRAVAVIQQHIVSTIGPVVQKLGGDTKHLLVRPD